MYVIIKMKKYLPWRIYMSTKIDLYIAALADYAVKKGLLDPDDRIFAINRILDRLNLHEFAEPEAPLESIELEQILKVLLDYAEENGIIEAGSVVYRDLFDTELMGLVTPLPSVVNKNFFADYKDSPKKATDNFYRLCLECDYIREYRIKKDLKWTAPSQYGEIDITINLSKPEKDPKIIAALRTQKQSGYPLCNLCHENVGYAGSASQPARQTLRQIPMELAGTRWYLQYSPYSYYNEHCIALSGDHTPMKINRALIEKALDFVDIFPHYFIGSNADLPIVGGSILTHDHMQGGNYTFAMAKADIEKELTFDGFEDIKAGIVRWPLSVIRLTGARKERLAELSEKILAAWRAYTDADAFIFAETDGEPHNTITPIARRRGELFEVDLVLRNNITTDEHPLGVYHPHAELHNIKKENIGLIEVMGLAVLPSRLKAEMEELADLLANGKELTESSPAFKHKAWLEKFADKYTFTKNNAMDILKAEIGATFVKVLEDAGVYKCTEEGRKAFLRFTASVGAK